MCFLLEKYFHAQSLANPIADKHPPCPACQQTFFGEKRVATKGHLLDIGRPPAVATAKSMGSFCPPKSRMLLTNEHRRSPAFVVLTAIMDSTARRDLMTTVGAPRGRNVTTSEKATDPVTLDLN
jgi:hypothetical protein